MTFDELIQILAAFIGSLGFAILFNIRGKAEPLQACEKMHGDRTKPKPFRLRDAEKRELFVCFLKKLIEAFAVRRGNAYHQ